MPLTSSVATINHRAIWTIAGPMILANISIPLLGMVDTAVVGHLDAAHYIGSVATGTLIFSFIFWGFGFLRMATTGLTAQAAGRNDLSASHNILQKSILLALFIALPLLALQTPLSNLAFSMIDSSEQVRLHGQNYFSIRIWSAPAILINYVILGWLIGQAKTGMALWLVLIVNISNIIFDLLFVSAFGLAVNGVAMASVIAEYLGLIFALFVLKRQGIRLIKPLLSSTADFSLTPHLSLHGNIFIRTLCLVFCFGFFTVQGAKQGDVILAANAVLLHFITFMAFFLDGFANAVEVICGQAMGSKNRPLLKKGFYYGAIWSVGIACLFCLVYAFLGPYIIRLLTSIPSVVSTAEDYLPWLIIAPIIAVWSYLFDGLFIGTMRSIEMRNTMLFSTLFCFLPAWYWLQVHGNHGLWMALMVFLAARGLSQAYFIPRILSA